MGGVSALISREFNSGEGNCSMGGVGWGEGRSGEDWGGDMCVCVCACERVSCALESIALKCLCVCACACVCVCVFQCPTSKRC